MCMPSAPRPSAPLPPPPPPPPPPPAANITAKSVEKPDVNASTITANKRRNPLAIKRSADPAEAPTSGLNIPV